MFVTALMFVMVGLAVWLGLRNKDREMRVKNKVLIISAITINAFELFKIILLCFRNENPMYWLYTLPLFLCSIQLITIPLAAFAKGRVKEAALDFVFIFGILGAVLGTYGAGQNYACYPVLSFDNVVSGITHAISGFASLYIAISKMQSMQKRNVSVVFVILLCFAVVAYIVNVIIDYNYMFLMRGDGTPYDIFYNLVNGNPVLYPLLVVVLFLLYISLFYAVYYLIEKKSVKE